MQQIADWLQKLGLGQYAQRFAENDINFPVLPHLTDQDLKELGVASLGHRRQLLLAIAELNGIQNLNFDDLQCSRHYRGLRAYQRSKLANRELAHRLEGTGVTLELPAPGFVAASQSD